MQLLRAKWRGLYILALNNIINKYITDNKLVGYNISL